MQPDVSLVSPNVRDLKLASGSHMQQRIFRSTAYTNHTDDPEDGTTYLLQPGLGFKIDGYQDGRPALTAPVLPDVFLLTQSNLKDVAVLEARAAAMVAPALHYVQDRFMNKRHKQVSRFKAAQIFDPLFVQENGPVADSDVKALKAFKFSKRPDLAKAIESMEEKISQYNKQIALIKPKAKRMVTAKCKPDDKKDSFDIQSMWRANRSNFPALARICRAVLTHLPNSCSPEAVFSILNDTS